MKVFGLICTAVAISTVSGSGSDVPSTLSICEVYRHPEDFDGQTIVVTGRIGLQFENYGLYCPEKLEDTDLGFGIWVKLDFQEIQKTSPRFYSVFLEGHEAARRWKGGLFGQVRVRGKLTVSDYLEEITGPNERVRKYLRSGLGHLGMSGAQIEIVEILDFVPYEEEDSNQTAGDNSGQREAPTSASHP